MKTSEDDRQILRPYRPCRPPWPPLCCDKANTTCSSVETCSAEEFSIKLEESVQDIEQVEKELVDTKEHLLRSWSEVITEAGQEYCVGLKEVIMMAETRVLELKELKDPVFSRGRYK